MVRILTSNLAHIVKMMLFLLSFDVDASAISTNSLLPFLGIQFIMHAFPRWKYLPTALLTLYVQCTYLFTYHRDEYRWYVHSETPGWDGKDPPPNPGQDGNLSTLFTKEMYFPKPRVATHARYRGVSLMSEYKIVWINWMSGFVFCCVR